MAMELGCAMEPRVIMQVLTYPIGKSPPYTNMVGQCQNHLRGTHNTYGCDDVCENYDWRGQG
eukprot:3884202-Prorocentrum_lima.AAC.1